MAAGSLSSQHPAIAETIGGSIGKYWYLWDRSGTWFSVYIQSDGDLTATQTGGGPCTFNGTVSLRPTGKNVFNITLNYPANGCSLSNVSLTGIALLTPINGHPELLMGVTDNANKTSNWLFGSQND